MRHADLEALRVKKSEIGDLPKKKKKYLKKSYFKKNNLENCQLCLHNYEQFRCDYDKKLDAILQILLKYKLRG